MANNGNKNAEKMAIYLKYGFIGFCALVVGVIVFAIFYMVYSNRYVASIYDVKTKRTVAKVPKEEFSYLFNQVKQQIYQKYGTNIDFATYAESARITALEAANDIEVQLVKAEEKGIKLNDKVRKKADELFNKYMDSFGDTSEEGIESQTKQVFGVNLKQLKNIYTKLALVNALMESEKADKAKWDKQVRKFYDTNLETFKKSEFRKAAEEAVWVRHILIKTVDEENKALPAEETKKAEKKARDILEKARKGEDFLKLVAENSEDFSSAAYGGDYIFARNSGMDKAFENAAFALKVGEISDLVKSSYGYHIIKLEERIPQGEPVSFKAAREYREYLVDDMTYQDMVDEWGKNYDVRKNNAVYNQFK